MISKMEDGTVLLEMGNGTLFSSVVKNQNDEVLGICFSNSRGKLQDGVVFQITSIEGITGYVRPLIALFEELVKKEDGEKEKFLSEVEDFKKFIEPFLPKEKQG